MCVLQAFLDIQQPTGQHHVHHHGGPHHPLNPHRAAPADKNAALTFRQTKDCRLVTHPHMGGRGQFQSAAHHGPVQCCHKGDGPPRHLVEHGVPVVPKALGRPWLLAGGPLEQFCQIQAGAEIVAMPEQDADLGLLVGAQHRLRQCADQGIVDGIAFFGAIEPQQGDIAIEFVRDEF